jgi:hypothetical protein
MSERRDKRMTLRCRQEPDDPLLSRHLAGIGGLQTPAFFPTQGGLLYASLDRRRGRPLPPLSQKSGVARLFRKKGRASRPINSRLPLI